MVKNADHQYAGRGGAMPTDWSRINPGNNGKDRLIKQRMQAARTTKELAGSEAKDDGSSSWKTSYASRSHLGKEYVRVPVCGATMNVIRRTFQSVRQKLGKVAYRMERSQELSSFTTLSMYPET
ncbi:hypothetical protein Tco_0697535 [Tanacetum coccineum]